MKRLIARSLGIGVLLAAGSITLTAGENPKTAQTHTPLITDWSTRHVIFSHPRTPEQAARMQRDVRYQQQLARMVHRTLSKEIDPVANARALRALRRQRRRFRKNPKLHRDWSWMMGSGATTGEGQYPAKYSFNITVANCMGATQPDFVVFPTGLASSASQASVFALTNLYAGCPNPTFVPADYWGFDTGGQVRTSPVLSLDGTQIAFTQTSGGVASLVLLKWAAFSGSAQAPTTLTPVLLASDYRTCTAPCMATFSLGADDSNSSVFYDYGGDVMWVGDNAGKLHQFTGVFKGTPAEVTTGWPVTVSGNILSSPVYDGSANTFVGDSGGFLYRVDSTTGAVTASARLDYGPGIVQGPEVDRVTGMVFVPSAKDGLSSTTAGLFQIPTNFTAGSTGTEATLGTASATTPMYNPGFNHDYLWSATSSGAVFACGNPGGNPTLYQIPITNAAMGTTAVTGPVLSGTSTTHCSPVTEIYNPMVTGQGLPLEWVFVSVKANGTPSGCTGFACVMNFRVTPWEPNTVYNAGQLILDSNNNIQVADNSGGTSGATPPPTWGTTPFAPTMDAGVNWRCQGPLSGPTPPGWTGSQLYAGGFEIVDTNNNIEIAQPPGGTSGVSQPTWPMGEGVTTTDGTVSWYNLGANPVSGLPASGGSSGFIMDNTLDNIGGSQVYFSTLNNQSCGGNVNGSGSGTGGCAVQASQQALQ